MNRLWLPIVVLLAGACQSKGPLLGGDSVEGVYVQDIGDSMLQAQRALLAVEATIMAQESHVDWARIDGRLADATPLRIRMDRVEDAKVKVTFPAGRDCSKANLGLAPRLRVEFETVTQLKAATC